MNGFAQDPEHVRFLRESNLGAGYQHNVNLIHLVIGLLNDPRQALNTTDQEALESIALEFGYNLEEIKESTDFINIWEVEFNIYSIAEELPAEEAFQTAYISALRQFLERELVETYCEVIDENLELVHQFSESFDLIDSKSKISAEVFENTLLRLESVLKQPRHIVNLVLNNSKNPDNETQKLLYPAVKEQFCFFGSILIDIDYIEDSEGGLILNHAHAYLNWKPLGSLGENIKEVLVVNPARTKNENGVYALSLDVTDLCFTKLALLLKLGEVSHSWSVEPEWNLLSARQLRESNPDEDELKKIGLAKISQLPQEFLSKIKYDSLLPND
jgi:hypothetical protein